VARKQNLLNLPLLRHYDKALALLALVFLLFSLVRLTGFGSDRKLNKENYIADLNNLKPKHEHVSPIDMAPFDQALTTLKSPELLAVASNEIAGLFVPERRVWCIECRRPIAFDAEKCPFCQVEQPGSVQVVDRSRDSDGDGIPDMTEIEWNLNPLDPLDAELDSDQDGFTNIEEFKAGTNARDPESHPDLGLLLIVKNIEMRQFPVILKGASRMGDGKWKSQINLLTADGREGQTIWVVDGEQIGNTGFRLISYNEKKEKQLNPRLNIMVDVDLSTATVVRELDKREFTLKVGDRQSSDLEAVLEFPMEKTTFPVTQGSVFKLRNKNYSVNNIDNQAFTVVIENQLTGKKITVAR